MAMTALFPRISSFCLHGDFRPDLFSWDRVVKMSPVERLEHAFSKAQTYLGIEKLLDPEGIVQYLISTLILHRNFELLKSSVFFFFIERTMRIEEYFSS